MTNMPAGPRNTWACSSRAGGAYLVWTGKYITVIRDMPSADYEECMYVSLTHMWTHMYSCLGSTISSARLARMVVIHPAVHLRLSSSEVVQYGPAYVVLDPLMLWDALYICAWTIVARDGANWEKS